MQTPTILVTGGAGFIGSNFIRFVLNNRPKTNILNFDCLTYAGNLNNLREFTGDPRYTFVRGDILDRTKLSRAVEQCDAIVHFAAESHVDRSIADATEFVSTNVQGTQTVLECARQWERRVVHVSTDEVYGSLPLDAPNLKFSEQTPLAPNSPYAASKAASDLFARAYFETYGLEVMTTRCSNNFGPYQYPEKLIPFFVSRLAAGECVPVYGDGRNIRDWIHVEDHCEAVLTVLEKGRAGETYNIGADNELSNIALTARILEYMGMSPAKIQFVEDRLGHDRRYAIDSSKIERELGWKATRSNGDSALYETIQWYLDNQSWLHALEVRRRESRVRRA